MTRLIVVTAVACGLLFVVGGCSQPPPPGFFVSSGDSGERLGATIAGVATKTDAGCWAVDTESDGVVAIVFPAGSTADQSGTSVTVPNLGVVKVGDSLTGGGGYFSPEDSGIDGIDGCGTDEVAILDPFG